MALDTHYSIHTSSGGDKVLTLDTDNFIIGDRVWVNGVRPGRIAYIGETSFAPGEWAGIALDDPTGKNDGSVGGRRYFYCGPNRGIFARLWRLTRYPLVPDIYRPESALSRRSCLSPTGKYDSTTSVSRSGSSLSRYRSLSRSPERKTYVTTFSSRPLSPSYTYASRSLSSLSSRDSYTKSVSFDTPEKVVTTITTTTTDLEPSLSTYMKVGDKVLVNSSKGLLAGRLRFLGHTDFAPGYWAGVELDEPVGKNDGTVAGKRYFWCPEYYGLFAPAYKVMKADPKRMTTVTRIHRSSSPEI